MLTLAKVEVYDRFNGDIDGFARSGADRGVSGITDADWREIAELRQALSIVASGIASPAFIAETEARLRAVAPDERTQAAIRELKD